MRMKKMNSEFMLERINIIDAYDEQIAALLDLMQCAESSVDMRSINTAAEMCQTMLAELKSEVDMIYCQWKKEEEASKTRDTEAEGKEESVADIVDEFFGED